ncbi:STE24 endopeptidase [Ignavibacterium album JCM 16511]|uniref:STE24 endopeptidase n=1 Tax=Ignavibacterium album (strain DSM 19864 / JCM 16511 / NBRC 101810 / Mat9-16) TaxID=945713 RepID=I0AL94_IGNAJ|nr:M48 family metallopeptidase [Ignavibacterium album]AFH49751.1 STE24 endopeptidase [Ignavibacterium album JCM 16511]
MNSKKYNNIKLAISISETVLLFILTFLFLSFGYSKALSDWLYTFTQSDYIVLVLFTIIIGVAVSIIFFPLNFYSSFILEHKYNLSNQTLLKYFTEGIKSTVVSGVIGIPILLLFYFILKNFGDNWWLVFAVAMFFISVILSQLFPIVIFPIFYKVKPIEDEELKERIKSLAIQAGLKVQDVYSFDMSKNTKKANAAFTGLGKTKRIILGDTLLSSYTKDEIETVIAHELGHYKKKHILKNIIYGTMNSFLVFYVISILYKSTLNWFGFSSITEIAALPLLTLWAMLIGLMQTPLGNMLSRKFEYEADQYAIETTKKPLSFIQTLNKLTDQNLGDKEPHPFVEWFFYSHPSIKKRVFAIEKFAAQKNIIELTGLKEQLN